MLVLSAIALIIASAVTMVGFPLISSTKMWLGFGMYLAALLLLVMEATGGNLIAMAILTLICVSYVFFFLGGLNAFRTKQENQLVDRKIRERSSQSRGLSGQDGGS
jgi:hypothetical protein